MTSISSRWPSCELGRRALISFTGASSASRAGFDLTTLKTGYGTGLDFRERPWISSFEDDELQPGMILAFDYGLEAHGGVLLHLEDRVAVTEGEPQRLSSGWDLRDARRGFGRLLGE